MACQLLMKNNINQSIINTLLLLAGMLLCASAAAEKEVTLLYTNDIESVYEPVEASWRDDMSLMGGMPWLATLTRELRDNSKATFLLDAGDIFTGSLSKATLGALPFDIYSAMEYDAVNLGNHEFEYGWRTLHNVSQRARFAVLNANIFYEGTDIPFSRAYVILERDGVKVAVIGSMGVDAFLNTMMKVNREGLSVKAPAAVLQPWIDQLREEVDLVVLLTHQNRTAPMQTNKEADPTVARGFDEDYALAGALSGVDMIIGGHSDHGLPEPVRHPATGTWIGMTYGQGMHVGVARFRLGEGRPQLVEGRLIPVNADRLSPDPAVSNLIGQARKANPALNRVIGHLTHQAQRRYYREANIGNLLADMLKDYAGTDLALVPSGAIRADLQAGEVTVEEILNVFPFTDTVATVTMTGEVLLELLEKGVSLDYGLVQFSGVELTYDTSRPVGSRVIEATIDSKPLEAAGEYSVAMGSFTATGGEGYEMLKRARVSIEDKKVSDVFISAFERAQRLTPPPVGRLKNLGHLAQPPK